MASVEIYNGTLAENAQNFSIFFSEADFIYLTSQVGEWSQTGDVVEVDADLIVTVEPGVKRRLPLGSFVDTKSVLRVPEEYSRTGFLMELVLQSSYSVQVRAIAVSPNPITDDEDSDRIVAILKFILEVLGYGSAVDLIDIIVGGNQPTLPPGGFIPQLPGNP